MAVGGTINWEIVRGISPRMVSDFLSSVFFSEDELSLEGVVQSVLEGSNGDRQAVIESRLAPLFENLQKNSVYVYRDRDHFGVHLTRTAE